jgi:tetratricopeptide (TPR) repeat protein
MMSQSTDAVPFRTKLRVEVSNQLQKHRSLLIWLVVAAIVVIAGLAIWTQVDASTKTTYAAQIEKSQADYTAWQTEADAAKKAELGKALDAELASIEKSAPTGYGLSKAWFLHGSYWAAQKNWAEAAKAFRAVFSKDASSYLAPIALVNAAVSLEESGDAAGALAAYADFEKAFVTDPVLAPQVLFTEGRLLESQAKTADAVAAYKKLLAKFPESGWTKLGRDRILLVSQD